MTDYSKINLDYTINSGQVFLWKNYGKYWYGINGQDILQVNSNSKAVKSFQNKKTDIFRKNDDLKKILREISKDKIVKNAVKNYLGLRILRQDPFQCIISFIVSSNSNIQNIRNSLENLCKKFGTKVDFNGNEFFTFPKPEQLANARLSEIKSCGTGYRSEYIKDTASMIIKEKIDFSYLKKINYFDAKKIIKNLPGVGDKVADCILLFSLEKLEAFPLDRWMLRILQNNFEGFEIKSKTLTEKQYETLHELIVQRFGKYAGYAQQFLFKMERDVNQKKWL